MNDKPLLEIKDLKKYFGGVKALDGVDMELYHKEIIAIVGDNGAGKSTLIKTISGVHQKTGGNIFINGEEAHINSPMDARNYGIETVYQDQGLISILDASLNLFLGREKIRENILGKFFKFTDDRYMKKETVELLKKLDVRLKDINAEVFNLSGGQRQTVVIGRAVYWGGKILRIFPPQ